MIAELLIDASMLFLFGALGIGAGCLHLTDAIVVSSLAAASLVFCSLSKNQPKGNLSTADILLSLSVLVMLGAVRIEPSAGVLAWWPVGPGLLALVSGLVLSMDARRRRLWTPQRTKLLAVLVVSLASVSSVALMAWGFLKLRSDSHMAPGRMDFLYQMFLWAAIWFGLDSRLRTKESAAGAGLRKLLRAGWRQEAVLLVIGLRLFLQVVS